MAGALTRDGSLFVCGRGARSTWMGFEIRAGWGGVWMRACPFPFTGICRAIPVRGTGRIGTGAARAGVAGAGITGVGVDGVGAADAGVSKSNGSGAGATTRDRRACGFSFGAVDLISLRTRARLIDREKSSGKLYDSLGISDIFGQVGLWSL